MLSQCWPIPVVWPALSWGVENPALLLACAGEAQVPLEGEWSLSSRAFVGLARVDFRIAKKLFQEESLGNHAKGHRFAWEKPSC
jgi:hypothetical protein